MEFAFTEEQELLRRTIREFAASEIAPHVMEWDERQVYPRDVVQKAAELGCLGAIFPEE